MGDPVTGGFALLPDNDRTRGSEIHVDLYKLDISTDPHVYVRVGRSTARFHSILGCFRFVIPTRTLSPGYYDVHLLLPDGTRIRLRVELTDDSG